MGMIWWLSGTAGAVLAVAFADLVSEEVRARLDRVPFGLLRLARRRLPAGLRESVHDQEWVPELEHILRRAEALPITRLISGSRYALGLAARASLIGAELLPRDTDEHPDTPREQGQSRDITGRWVSALHSVIWPVREPSRLRVYLLTVVTAALAATGTAAAFTAFHAQQLEVFLALAAFGVIIESNIRFGGAIGPLSKDMFATWGLPVAILLPPLYGLIAPIPYFALLQWRQPPPHT